MSAPSIGTVAQRAAAAEWLRAHRAELPLELPEQLEPACRGHRGHTYAAELSAADVIAAADACDPLGWLLAAEAAAELARSSRWHRDIADADGTPASDGHRRSYRGPLVPTRTAERRRAQRRTAAASGQLEMTGWGWLA